MWPVAMLSGWLKVISANLIQRHIIFNTQCESDFNLWLIPYMQEYGLHEIFTSHCLSTKTNKYDVAYNI